MPVAHLAGRSARIDVSLEGVTFTRSASDALRLGVEQVQHHDWDAVTGAAVQTTGKGRAVVRVEVGGAPSTAPHREDPLALKVRRRDSDLAHALVEQINAEAAGRRRWAESSDETAQEA